jgi:hypothetical protein
MPNRITREYVGLQLAALRKNGVSRKVGNFFQKMYWRLKRISRTTDNISQATHQQTAPTGSSQSGNSGQLTANEHKKVEKLLENIADGSLVFESTDAFSRIISECPEDPELLRIYADHLSFDKRKVDAIAAYAKAAALFFMKGMIFKGWHCKALEWQLRPAPREQLTEVQNTIWNASPKTPLDYFVKQLTWAERLAVFSRLRRHSLPSGAEVISAGTGKGSLYCVISGVLKEDGPQGRLRPRTLREMDIFGFAGTIERDIRLPKVISVSRVELVELPSEHLQWTFRHYPNVEEKFQLLYHKSEEGRQIAPENLRKGERHFIRSFMSLAILPTQVDEPPMVLRGFSNEISLTGVSFIPEQDDAPNRSDVIKNAARFVGRQVLVKILTEGISVEVQGQIVRADQVSIYGNKLWSFGVKFAEISPQVRWMLFTFASNASVHLPEA